MNNNPSDDIELAIGIDWADTEHEVCIIGRDKKSTKETLKQCPKAIDAWVERMLKKAKGRPIGILLEGHRGGLLHALMNREKVLIYQVNPNQAACYRASYSTAGSKCDRVDARLLARMLRERHTILKPLQPDDEQTRLIGRLCEVRREMVGERVKCVQKLTAHLKAYFPLVLTLGKGKVNRLVLGILKRWQDPRQLKRAHPDTIRRVLHELGCKNSKRQSNIVDAIRPDTKLLTQDRALIEPYAIWVKSFIGQIKVLNSQIDTIEKEIAKEANQHPDIELFRALPGAGEQMAPRLLAAFGSQRDRFKDANAVAAFSGIAPVTKQSGKSKLVIRRYAAPKFLRQTFHEFAGHASKWCTWSKAYYNMQKQRGMKHNAILRKLAMRWIRILFRVWKDRTPYDPKRYLETMTAKNPAIRAFLPTPEKSSVTP